MNLCQQVCIIKCNLLLISWRWKWKAARHCTQSLRQKNELQTEMLHLVPAKEQARNISPVHAPYPCTHFRLIIPQLVQTKSQNNISYPKWNWECATESTHNTNQLHTIKSCYTKCERFNHQINSCQQSEGKQGTITCPLGKLISGPFPDQKDEHLQEEQEQPP